MRALRRFLGCAFLLLVALLALGSVPMASSGLGREFSREDFPPAPNFVFGSGTSAYQVEGAAAEDGRSPSVWDTAAHAGRIANNATGDVACDGYHKYKDDVKLMMETGLEAYRFSISWSRLLPEGRGVINQKGLDYYNSLIDELVSHGIQPHVTLFHYDLPQVLEDEYLGWLDPRIVDDFSAYADVCFREFGDRVSHWTTLNEPNILSIGGYDAGADPPFRCSAPFGSNCVAGDSTWEPYVAAHNCLLAHAAVASLYKRKYQAKQRGIIGLNIFVYHILPLTSSPEDKAAARRAQDFFSGWFLKPLVYGDYPISMKERTGSKMPSFTKYQKKQMKGSFDFLGINHYGTLWISEGIPDKAPTRQRDFMRDMSVKFSVRPSTDSLESSYPITPYGMQGVLEYLKCAYGNPPVYIHENGYSTPHSSSLEDVRRVKYLEGFIGSLLDAIRNGSNARGYFTWSFLDVFELMDGYRSSYGLYSVDFEHKDLQRRPKLSAHWYSQFLRNNMKLRQADLNLAIISMGEPPNKASMVS